MHYALCFTAFLTISLSFLGMLLGKSGLNVSTHSDDLLIKSGSDAVHLVLS